MNCRDLYTFMGSSIRPFMLINLTRLCSKSYIIGGMTESCLICFSLFCGTEDRMQWGHKQMVGTQHLGREWCSSAVYSWRTSLLVVFKWGSHNVSAVLRFSVYTVAHLLLGEAVNDFGNLMLASCNCCRQTSSSLSNPATEIKAHRLKKKTYNQLLKWHCICTVAQNKTKKLDQIFHWKAIKTPQALLTLFPPNHKTITRNKSKL